MEHAETPITGPPMPAVFLLLAAFFAPLVFATPCSAFLVPGNTSIGAGSRWEYDSNLGRVVVEILERTEIPMEGGSCRTFYRWRLKVKGLTYDELLELVPGHLFTWERSFAAFGVMRTTYSYPRPEYTMPSPLPKAGRWAWEGLVRAGPLGVAPHTMPAPWPPPPPGLPPSPAGGPPPLPSGDLKSPGAANPSPRQANDPNTGWAAASGYVVGLETLEVPAGRFQAYHVHLERADEFGTQEVIDLWVNPEIGVIAAEGELLWGGLPGKIQRLIGLDRLSVRLRQYELSRS